MEKKMEKISDQEFRELVSIVYQKIRLACVNAKK